MAENGNDRNTESFVLGIIVAMILFLLFRKEFDKIANRIDNELKPGSGKDGRTGKSGGCGGVCGGGCDTDFAQNPGISLGGKSYSGAASFSESSVIN